MSKLLTIIYRFNIGKPKRIYNYIIILCTVLYMLSDTDVPPNVQFNIIF